MPVSDITPGELRAMLRDHALVISPGEVLIVTVPPVWRPQDVRDINDALKLAGYELGIRLLVVPGTAVTVGRMPLAPLAGAEPPAGDLGS
jgi:hypothetical protein